MPIKVPRIATSAFSCGVTTGSCTTFSLTPDDEVHIVGVFHGAMRFEEYLK
jgi:hypothetical protein